MTGYAGALDAVRALADEGGDADDVLRSVVDTLRERCGYDWVAVTFFEDDDVVEGPSSGPGWSGTKEWVAVTYNGVRVGALHAAPARDAADVEFLRQVAELIAPYCLVGWDTGGEPWEP